MYSQQSNKDTRKSCIFIVVNISTINEITIPSVVNFINQGFAGLNNTITQGFAGVDNAICTLGYQNQAGFNALGTQIASTGCDIRQAICPNAKNNAPFTKSYKIKVQNGYRYVFR